jgi:TPR repeat protein
VAPASSPVPAVPRESYIGDDLKDLQIHADAGDAAAEYRLGMRYATGEDVKQDYEEAMRWFLRAADQGDVHAQATVAVWLMAGRGAPQDYGRAYYWALLAQAGGDESGRAIVLNSAPYLSPAQTGAAQKQAEDWLHSHHIGQAPTESAQ